MAASASADPSASSTLAIITKCSGKDRLRFEKRHPVGSLARRHHQPRPHGDDNDSAERMLATGEVRHGHNATTSEEWFRSTVKGFPAVSVSSRSKICLVSICSVLNATQPQQNVEVAAIVDEDTPTSVLEGYGRLGVRIIDLSGVAFPSYFNNRTANDPDVERNFTAFRRRTPLPPGASTRKATLLGYPHFSSLPDSFYKLFVWNLTEYKRVFYFDPDTLARRNVTEAYLRYEPFAAQIHPRQGPMHSLQAGMMVLQPSRRDFEHLHTMWQSGDYPYPDGMRRGDVSYGDDDQMLLAHALFRKRLLSTPLHRFALCDNDKRGSAHCDPAKVPMFHKWPIWEHERIETLWDAAQNGRCTGNRALLEWRPTSTTAGPSTRAFATAPSGEAATEIQSPPPSLADENERLRRENKELRQQLLHVVALTATPTVLPTDAKAKVGSGQ